MSPPQDRNPSTPRPTPEDVRAARVLRAIAEAGLEGDAIFAAKELVRVIARHVDDEARAEGRHAPGLEAEARELLLVEAARLVADRLDPPGPPATLPARWVTAMVDGCSWRALLKGDLVLIDRDGVRAAAGRLLDGRIADCSPCPPHGVLDALDAALRAAGQVAV